LANFLNSTGSSPDGSNTAFFLRRCFWEGLEEAPRGTETLLLVEDEDAIRALISTVPQESGYTVPEAGGVKEAIRVTANWPS
jgi:hypothetical protein